MVYAPASKVVSKMPLALVSYSLSLMSTLPALSKTMVSFMALVMVKAMLVLLSIFRQMLYVLPP